MKLYVRSGCLNRGAFMLFLSIVQVENAFYTVVSRTVFYVVSNSRFRIEKLCHQGSCSSLRHILSFLNNFTYMNVFFGNSKMPKLFTSDWVRLTFGLNIAQSEVLSFQKVCTVLSFYLFHQHVRASVPLALSIVQSVIANHTRKWKRREIKSVKKKRACSLIAWNLGVGVHVQWNNHTLLERLDFPSYPMRCFVDEIDVVDIGWIGSIAVDYYFQQGCSSNNQIPHFHQLYDQHYATIYFDSIVCFASPGSPACLNYSTSDNYNFDDYLETLSCRTIHWNWFALNCRKCVSFVIFLASTKCHWNFLSAKISECLFAIDLDFWHWDHRRNYCKCFCHGAPTNGAKHHFLFQPHVYH